MTAEEYVIEELKRTKEILFETEKMLKIYKEQVESLVEFQDEVAAFFKNKANFKDGDGYDGKYFFTSNTSCYENENPKLYKFVKELCYIPKLDTKIENLTQDIYCDWITAMGLSVRSANCLCRFYSNQDRPDFRSFKEMLEWLKETDNLIKIRNIQKQGAKEVSEKAKELLNQGE